MKYYDYPKIKQIISENADNLQSASIGMHEDWFWTGGEVWKDGSFLKDLPDNAVELEEAFQEARKNGLSMFLKEKDEKGLPIWNPDFKEWTKHQIGGCFGSHWATPTLQLNFKNGSEKMIEVSTGSNDPSGKPPMLHGCISGPVQNEITPIT